MKVRQGVRQEPDITDIFQAGQVLLVLLSSLLVSATQSEGRQIQLQNISLVITYTGMVVAVIMMLGFLYVALNFGGGRSSHGYSYDEYNYSKRSPGRCLANNLRMVENERFSEPSVLSYILDHLNKYEEEEE